MVGRANGGLEGDDGGDRTEDMGADDISRAEGVMDGAACSIGPVVHSREGNGERESDLAGIVDVLEVAGNAGALSINF